jgi:hypothetical protein
VFVLAIVLKRSTLVKTIKKRRIGKNVRSRSLSIAVAEVVAGMAVVMAVAVAVVVIK